jgi:hypothetical protein
VRDRYSGMICVVWYKPFHNYDVDQVEEMLTSAVKLIGSVMAFPSLTRHFP